VLNCLHVVNFLHPHLAYLDLLVTLSSFGLTSHHVSATLVGSHALQGRCRHSLRISLNSLPTLLPGFCLLPLVDPHLHFRLVVSCRLPSCASFSVLHTWPCVIKPPSALPLPRAGLDSFSLFAKHVFVNQHPGGEIQPLVGDGRQLVGLLLLQLAVTLKPVRLAQGQRKSHGAGQTSSKPTKYVQPLNLILWRCGPWPVREVPVGTA
jgi:hypothetical protein